MEKEVLWSFWEAYQLVIGGVVGFLGGVLFVWVIASGHKRRKQYYRRLWLELQEEHFLLGRQLEDAKLELNYLRGRVEQWVERNTYPKDEE